MPSLHTLVAATLASLVALPALAPAPAAAAVIGFRVTLDPGSPLGGTHFVQQFQTSFIQGDGSYTEHPGPYVIETRRVFGSATALDNDLLVALQAETGTAGWASLDSFVGDQTIFDNFVAPKSYSYGITFTDRRDAIEELSPDLFKVGSLVVAVEGNSSSNDPGSPLAGFYLDSPRNLRTVLRNTPLRFTATSAVYTYDNALEQVVSVQSFSRYMGTASFVPEPGSWAMLIAGFGLIGAVQRRRVSLLPRLSAASTGPINATD